MRLLSSFRVYIFFLKNCAHTSRHSVVRSHRIRFMAIYTIDTRHRHISLSSSMWICVYTYVDPFATRFLVFCAIVPDFSIFPFHIFLFLLFLCYCFRRRFIQVTPLNEPNANMIVRYCVEWKGFKRDFHSTSVLYVPLIQWQYSLVLSTLA